MSNGTGVLATIGSTAPFVGLFGTVWGIMNSFIGIAKTQTTNLAVVAPGIAEALLATALGLVARSRPWSSTTSLPAPSPATRHRCPTPPPRCCCWSAVIWTTRVATAPPRTW